MHVDDAPPRRFPWTALFVVLASVFGVIFVLATPVLAGTDEPAHVSRVALISAGHVVPPTGDQGSRSYRADDCISAYITHYRLAIFFDQHERWRDQFHNPPCIPSEQPLADSARTADVYSPVPYLPALVGFRVGRAITGAWGSVFGARLFQLIAYIALMAYAIARTPWGRPLLFTIGLLPVSIQGAANVSADPLTLALACSVIASTLWCTERARTDKTITARDWCLLAVTIVALCLSKSAYAPFALLILAVPTAAFVTARRRLGITAAVLGMAVTLAGAWNFGVVSRIEIVGVHHSDSTLAARWIRRHPFGFVTAILRGWRSPVERHALLGGFFTPVHRFARNLPFPLVPGFLWLLVARLVDPVPAIITRTTNRWSRRRSRGHPSDEVAIDGAAAVGGPDGGLARRDRIVQVVVAFTVAAATFLLIEYGLAIAANPPAAHRIIWVQGRYFLPLLPLTLYGVARPGTRLPQRWLAVLPGLSAAALAWWLWWATHDAWHWW